MNAVLEWSIQPNGPSAAKPSHAAEYILGTGCVLMMFAIFYASKLAIKQRR